jgi:protein HokB
MPQGKEKKAMKLPRNTLLGCVLIVCLTLLIFTYLTRNHSEIRYRDTNREVAALWLNPLSSNPGGGNLRHQGLKLSGHT